jgi:hypothetical protein
MPNAAIQETPFFLVHDAEAVLPVEITHEAPRRMMRQHQHKRYKTMAMHWMKQEIKH